MKPDQARRLASELLDEGPVAPPEAVPARIGGYSILRQLGAGGMGIVYEAAQDQPQRRVALKVLRPHASSPEARRRFDREIELLGRLEHSNIARVYDAGVWTDRGDALPFFAMEFIPGAESITAYCESRQLTLTERVALFTSACAAVHHGHLRGVAHRDLKPENILVGDGTDGSGAVKVIDFGIAQLTDVDVTRTHVDAAGSLTGSLAYMSPEQCSADGTVVDTRSDVYSLGAVLYELLCGQRPRSLSGLTLLQALDAIRTQEPPQPRETNPDLSADLEAVLLKALARSPEDRYSSVAALQDDLERYLRREPVLARPHTLPRRLARWLARNPSIIGTLALVNLSLLSLGVVVLWSAYVGLYSVHEFRPSHTDPKLLQSATLVSPVGRILGHWDAQEPGRLRAAEYVPAESAADGRPRVVIAYSLDSDVEDADALRIFEGDWEVPKLRLRPSGAPPSGAPAPDKFGVAWADVDDYLPNLAGHEILAVFTTPGPGVSYVGLYNLDGNVLSEFWHAGTISGAQRVDEGTLVFCAMTSAKLPREWHPELWRDRHPMVLFAIQPRLGWKPTGWINVGSQPDLLWYHGFMPITLNAEYRLGFPVGPGSAEVVVLRGPNNRPIFRAKITPDGGLVPKPSSVPDSLKTDESIQEFMDSIELGPFPE